MIDKINSERKRLFQKYQEYHIGYELKDYPNVLWMPFWEFHGKIVVDESIPVDELSKIFLCLISNGLTSHSDICEFLGVNESSFIFMHMDFLIRHDIVRHGEYGYEMTHAGKFFLNQTTAPRQNRTIDFKCIYNESDEKFYRTGTFPSWKFHSAINSKTDDLIFHNPHMEHVDIIDFAKFYNSMSNGDSVFYELQEYSKPKKKFSPAWLFWYVGESGNKFDVRKHDTDKLLILSQNMEARVEDSAIWQTPLSL